MGPSLKTTTGYPICTTVTLRSRVNNGTIRVFNTHLITGFRYPASAAENTDGFMEQYDSKMSMPTFLIGDLNSERMRK